MQKAPLPKNSRHGAHGSFPEEKKSPALFLPYGLTQGKIWYNEEFVPDAICHILGIVLLLLGVWTILLKWHVFIPPLFHRV